MQARYRFVELNTYPGGCTQQNARYSLDVEINLTKLESGDPTKAKGVPLGD